MVRTADSAPPYRAAVVATDLGGDARVRFDGWGMPDGGGSVTVTAAGQQRTVTVDPETGAANVE
jgi:hypothetical protein